MMNISKQSALALTFLTLTTMNIYSCDGLSTPVGADTPSYFSHLFDNAKDNAKFAAWVAGALAVICYFFRNPDDRLSNAPFERVLKGFFDNILGDTFNWDNVTSFSDIIPGQRWKSYSTLLIGKSDLKVRLVMEGRRKDIKGFGLLHFLEKDMSKIFKVTAALGISYAFMMGKMQETLKEIVGAILNPYSKDLFENIFKKSPEKTAAQTT
jgi:hypothetical protein